MWNHHYIIYLIWYFECNAQCSANINYYIYCCTDFLIQGLLVINFHLFIRLGLNNSILFEESFKFAMCETTNIEIGTFIQHLPLFKNILLFENPCTANIIHVPQTSWSRIDAKRCIIKLQVYLTIKLVD